MLFSETESMDSMRPPWRSWVIFHDKLAWFGCSNKLLEEKDPP